MQVNILIMIEVTELPKFNSSRKRSVPNVRKNQAVYVLRALALYIGLDEFYFDKIDQRRK